MQQPPAARHRRLIYARCSCTGRPRTQRR
jgi:hypothetical protein